MTTSRRRTESGFTMFEVVVAMLVLLTGLAVIGKLLGTTQTLAAETRTHSAATTEQRHNLRALTNILRNVDIRTFQVTGEGSTTTVLFQRVTGADLADKVYGGVERIVWRASTRPVPGIPNPGALVLVGASGDRTVAKNVPLGGFEVRQEGGALAIRLTTYYSTGPDCTVSVVSETAVSLRN